MNRFVVILAAGKGTRMKSDMPKVLHQVGGKAMVELVLDASEALNPQKIVTVVGHGAEQVNDVIAGRSAVVEQKEQLGTGHAILMAEEELADQEGMTLIASGDAPLFTVDTLQNLFAYHANSGTAVTVLTAKASDPTGYGRIVRDDLGNVVRIVEQKDATPAEASINEINTGVYVFNNKLLFDSLHDVTNDNAQGEYYLPDTLEILRTQGYTVGAYTMDDFDESMGVNDRVALARANAVLRKRTNEQHMRNGVTLLDPQATYIDVDVKIGADTIIEPNVVLKGETVIGSHVHLTTGTQIIDSVVEDNAVIDASHLEEAHVGVAATVGPFAHLRPKAVLGEEAHAGNFVEVKKAELGKRSKLGHLSYLGDATVGEDVNLGAGTIFVNYDGMDKHHTTVGDRSFIGSGTKIIAPVTIGDEALTAAGSTISDDVPSHAMGIARSRQTTKPDFWKRTPLFTKFGEHD
ncbi:bifunctional UDP-N-acetylglucosamine diphosphorylase/glucosamine-1-phosphate N-acetyltransferase GlmU [Weissella minor]|uniref:bifunctional UDP-N-acetylglucosamine diphosphorylase/glucosamine-1-phosphate N-acetyltransferase GlmU n=1 Tax=Weissella minor TaxID=1620 RepID=UPI003AF2404B